MYYFTHIKECVEGRYLQDPGTGVALLKEAIFRQVTREELA
jgi:hypothetical protein